MDFRITPSFFRLNGVVFMSQLFNIDLVVHHILKNKKFLSLYKIANEQHEYIN